MKRCMWVLAFGSMLLAAGMAQAQGGRRFGGGFGGPPEMQMLELLRNEDVRKELQIVDDQVEKLRAMGDKLREEMREAFRGFGELNEEQRRARFEEMREKGQARAAEMQKEIGEILLPNQVERLKQLQVQMRMRFGGASGLLADRRVAEELGITEEQQQKLRAKAEEVNKELREKIQKITEEAREELLQELTADQREKVKKMIGAPYEFRLEQQGDGQRRDGERRREGDGN